MKTFKTPSVKSAVIHFFIPHSPFPFHTSFSVPSQVSHIVYHITSPAIVMSHKQKK